MENIQRAALAKTINTLCRKVLKCPYCYSINGTVKKAGALKITHERYRSKTVKADYEDFKKGFGGAIRQQREIGGMLGKAFEDVHALRCLEIFKKISDEDCELLGLKPELGRPEDYIWQYVHVPPVCVRPSIPQDGATNEDDLTVKLAEIIWANTVILNALQKGDPASVILEQWEFLQNSVALYINSEAPGMPQQAVSRGGRERIMKEFSPLAIVC